MEAFEQWKLLLSTEGWENQPDGKNCRPYTYMYIDYIYFVQIELIQCSIPYRFKLVIHILSIC